MKTSAHMATIIPGRRTRGRAHGILSQTQLLPMSMPQTTIQIPSNMASTINSHSSLTMKNPMPLAATSKGIRIRVITAEMRRKAKRAIRVKMSVGLCARAKATLVSRSRTLQRQVN